MKDRFECNRLTNHYYDCGCLPCESRLAFCKCSSCIERRTKFSGRFVDDRDFSKHSSLQQLVNLENK